METHFAELGLFRVAPDGRVYSISHAPGITMKDALIFTTEHRIIPDSSIPNTANHPTIKQYLNLEAAANFKPVQLTQSFIITVKEP